jgi:unsaturated chondroitin disaccharide hydrolase
MKKFLYTILILTGILYAESCSGPEHEIAIDKELSEASQKLETALENMNDTTVNPKTVEDGTIVYGPASNWTSGFFPGILWMIYDYTGADYWREKAHHYTMNVEEEQYNGTTHDMGFKIYCSFGNGYRLTGNKSYRDVMIQSASTLITRYNPVVGCIRSWDHNDDKWDFPVIIDNMMNLELLFWATRETNDSIYYDIAVKHAETTMQNHFREDYSSYHVVSYDTITGEVTKKNTHQGYSHGSAWARGQAWGLYGYTMTYRETGYEPFLEQAEAIANFILNHPNLPEDKIPYWDFDAPGQPDTYRDVSAAAILASALYELANYSPEKEQEYLGIADEILSNLSSETYKFIEGPNMPFILDRSVGNYNTMRQMDVPLIYADYYYIEALIRKKALVDNGNLSANIN